MTKLLAKQGYILPVVLMLSIVVDGIIIRNLQTLWLQEKMISQEIEYEHRAIAHASSALHRE